VSTAVLEGVRLAYDVAGSGEPVLLVQGLGYGRSGWGPAPGLLVRRFQVVTYDSRGFG
jgi:pimeloyl-ACP methyl ester carboxylesterase